MARLKTRLGLIAAVAVAALSTACAALFPSLEDDPHFGEYFTMRTGGQSQQLKLEGPRLFGPDVEIKRMADGYRGNANGNLVDLRSDGEKIEGSIGNGRTELHVKEADGALIVKGLYGGKLGELELREATLHGNLGLCQYDLRRPSRESIWYEGNYACAGSIRGVRLALPTSLAQRTPDDRAVLLALVLGR